MPLLLFVSLDLDLLLLGDLDLLFNVLFELESSLPLCSSSLRFPEAEIEDPDLVAETKSTDSLGVFDFSCSFAFAMRFCEAFSSST